MTPDEQLINDAIERSDEINKLMINSVEETKDQAYIDFEEYVLGHKTAKEDDK